MTNWCGAEAQLPADAGTQFVIRTSTVIITHTYDYPFASLVGANFLGGLIKTKAWMKRFMDDINVPDKLQTQVIRVVMDAMAEELLKIPGSRDRFIVADTRRTLLDRKDWLNEIHPTKEGFADIARVMYREMRTSFPVLGPP